MNKITLLSEIKSADWQKMQNNYGAVVEGIDDIKQCILTILTTPKGSVPLDPNFGCDAWQYIDQPVNQARAHIVREITNALRLNEKRINVTRVSVVITQDAYSAVVRVYYDVKNSAIKDFTEVSYARAA